MSRDETPNSVIARLMLRAKLRREGMSGYSLRVDDGAVGQADVGIFGRHGAALAEVRRRGEGRRRWAAPAWAVPYAAIFHAALLLPMQHAFVGFALCVFYLLLRLKDSALLVGSIALFLLLACLMYVPRRMNWTT
jgi:hypothetical protein